MNLICRLCCVILNKINKVGETKIKSWKNDTRKPWMALTGHRIPARTVRRITGSYMTSFVGVKRHGISDGR